MRDEYPGFAVLHTRPWIILWRGELTPYSRPYEAQLLYCTFSMPLASIERNTVHVEILAPLLERRPKEPETPIPHVWPNKTTPERPRLCLHRGGEWTSSMYIADSIVPWTIEWLAAYEGWRATGTWYAGGHDTERDDPRRRSQTL